MILNARVTSYFSIELTHFTPGGIKLNICVKWVNQFGTRHFSISLFNTSKKSDEALIIHL